MSGCAALNWAILLLYIWPVSFRTVSIFGMLSSPLPFVRVDLEMLSLSLGFALFHAAKADSKEYFWAMKFAHFLELDLLHETRCRRILGYVLFSTYTIDNHDDCGFVNDR